MPASLKRLATDDGSVSPPPTKRKVQATATSNAASLPKRITRQSIDTEAGSAVANFFKPASQKEPEKTTWRILDGSLLACHYDCQDTHADERPRKIAAFDFDSTLIIPASGKKFAQGANDWKWWDATVPSKLQELVADGYMVAIISNQGGIGLNASSKTAKSDQKRLNDFKQKVKAVLHQLDLPISLYAATAHDKYRKPRVGMWDTLLEDKGLQLADIDMAGSYFVGDAGGRLANDADRFKADFSCSDRDMASNIGITYYTPEEYFLKQETRPFARTFDPARYLAAITPAQFKKDTVSYEKKYALDLILFCGSPGAGKSTFFWTHLKPLGYERVNQDILGSRKACILAAVTLLKAGKSVVIDNTNADVDTRAQWLAIATDLHIPVRCILFTADPKLCEHNNAVRALGGVDTMNPEHRPILPKVAFTSFASRYREPNVKEGLRDVVKIDFEFNGTEEQRYLWRKYWI